MQIAFLNELFHPNTGGTEVRLYEISKRLAARGHSIDVFTIQHSQETPQCENLDGVNVIRYAYSPDYEKANGFRSLDGVLRYSISTVMKVIRTRYDIYYFGQWPIFHSILTKPFISKCVQEWCEVWDRKIFGLEMMLSRVMKNHVAVSEFTKKRMISLLSLKPDLIEIVPNGVDFKKYNEGSQNKKWGRLVYIGRLAHHKKLDLSIDAFRIIRSKTSEIELYIAGTGKLLQTMRRYEKRIEGLKVLGHISEEEKVKLLRSSWLFALPSNREGSSIAILEAMAAGTPVLTLNYPDNAAKDICSYGNGVVTDTDPSIMASTILQLLSNEEEWNHMKKESRNYVREYDWDIIVSRLEGYFHSIMQSN